jgi:hypothetical protein
MKEDASQAEQMLRMVVWFSFPSFEICKTIGEVNQADEFIQREVADQILGMRP